MNKLFYKTYLLISKNRMWSLLGLLLLIAALGFLAKQIRFEEDISKLIPSNANTKQVQKVMKSVNFTDKIIVNIKRQPNSSVDDLIGYASQFIDSVEKHTPEYVKEIQGRVDDDAIDTTLDFLYHNAPLFLDDSDYNLLAQKIQPDSIKHITESNYKILLSPSGIIAKKSIIRDPLGVSFMALKKLEQLGVGDQFTLKDGFLISKDEQNVLLFIAPEFPSSETSENAIFADRLYTIQDDLNLAFTSKVESEYFGAALIAVANAQQIKKDIQFTVGIALSILMFIFIVFYRRITIPLILFTPTAFGGLLSIAFLYMIREEISAISLGIGSVLLGVTLDYSLHILTHLRNNETVNSLYRDITKPILMSSLTTALAFLCLLFLDSQALQDLGIFAAVSVIGASIFALLFIPQFYKGGAKRSVKATVFDRLASYPFEKNKIFIGLVVVLLTLSAFTYNKVVFNKDISKLNFEPEIATVAKNNLDALTNIASKSVYLAAYGETSEVALQANDLVFHKLKKLKTDGELISFNSVGALVNSEKNQQNRISKWGQFWNLETRENIKNNLIESGAEFGFKSTTFNRFYSLIEHDFKPLEISEFNGISTISINDFITQKDDITTVTSLVKVDETKTELVRNTFQDDPNVLVIDRQGMNEKLLGGLKDEFNSLIGYSLLVVIIILLLFFRSLSLTMVTSLPIFLTWFITIGVMGLLKIEFNIFNIIISTFIFGLGIDYSIFITNGMLKEYRTGERTLATHKTSIILSVVTTILGVGVLIFAKHPALYSISVVSIIGIFSAMFLSFTIQPLLFRLFIGSRTKRPISLRLFVHSVLSFGYYGLGGLCLSIFSVTIMKLIPLSKKVKMRGFHKVISKFMKSVLYSNPFVKKRVVNKHNETFVKPGIIIANHTSFLDILAMGMLHPKIIFLVNDWVYNSPIFGKAVQLAGFYPVSGGIEGGVEHLQTKVDQGYSLMAFPEGTRSTTNKIRRFHKGAFFLAEKLNLDVIPTIIHGNSEVLPKGSFIIRDGSITVTILKRIRVDDSSFGKTSRERTKLIGAYLRTEFQKVRSEIEKDDYFHEIVKLDYRYKGDALYSKIVKRLKDCKAEYKSVIDTVDKRCSILNLSNEDGLLDFLLLLDSTDRKICTYIKDEMVRDIVKNSFITNHYNRISFVESKEAAVQFVADTIIVNTIDKEKFDNYRKENDIFLDFGIVGQNDKLIIFKQKGNT